MSIILIGTSLDQRRAKNQSKSESNRLGSECRTKKNEFSVQVI